MTSNKSNQPTPPKETQKAKTEIPAHAKKRTTVAELQKQVEISNGNFKAIADWINKTETRMAKVEETIKNITEFLAEDKADTIRERLKWKAKEAGKNLGQ